MTDFVKKSYSVSGNGVLSIDGDAVFISITDKGEFNLARVLADLDGCVVKFSFSYDEDVEKL